MSKISFTGSSEVGKLVAHSAADRIANVTLELGGKSPCVIFPDACTPERLDATAQGVVNAMRFARQGQSCTAGSRLFVHTSVWDDLMPLVASKAAAMTVGDALDEQAAALGAEGCSSPLAPSLVPVDARPPRDSAPSCAAPRRGPSAAVILLLPA